MMTMDTHPLALGLRVSVVKIWFLFVRVGIRSNIWTGLCFFRFAWHPGLCCIDGYWIEAL